MNKKLHDAVRVLQWLIPAAATLYGVIDGVLGIGYAKPVLEISGAVVVFLGVVAENSSASYFKKKTIVDRIEDDTIAGALANAVADIINEEDAEG